MALITTLVLTAFGYLFRNWHRYRKIWYQIGGHVNRHRCHNGPGAKPWFDGSLNEFGGTDFSAKLCRFGSDVYVKLSNRVCLGFLGASLNI